ncbi:MAG: hypothetical protein M0Z34_05660 [Nitrospiraceae bacterium]|nr:hypothetical protein [Nitrospiraceae bacterium]
MGIDAAGQLHGLRTLATVAGLCMIGVLAFGLLGGAALLRPVDSLAGRPTTYTSRGVLSYAGIPDSNSIYGTGGAASGMPLFISQLSAVRFDYRYQLAGGSTKDLAGTISLVLAVEDQGIRRIIARVGPQHFNVPRAAIQIELPLAAYKERIGELDAALGPGLYALAVEPQVQLKGMAGGQPLKLHFGSPYAFQASATSIVPAQAGGTVSATGVSPAWFVQSAAQEVLSTTPVQSRIGVGPVMLPVSSARDIGLAGFTVLTAIAALLTSRLRGKLRHDVRLQIAWKHQGSLIKIERWPGGDFRVVEVDSMPALAGLAKRLEVPILQLDMGDSTSYLVLDGLVGYRYTAHFATVMAARARRSKAGINLPQNAPAVSPTATTTSPEVG